ncbi:unnamed protein product [Leuciscus chuanchicus]
MIVTLQLRAQAHSPQCFEKKSLDSVNSHNRFLEVQYDAARAYSSTKTLRLQHRQQNDSDVSLYESNKADGGGVRSAEILRRYNLGGKELFNHFVKRLKPAGYQASTAPGIRLNSHGDNSRQRTDSRDVQEKHGNRCDRRAADRPEQTISKVMSKSSVHCLALVHRDNSRQRTGSRDSAGETRQQM